MRNFCYYNVALSQVIEVATELSEDSVQLICQAQFETGEIRC